MVQLRKNTKKHRSRMDVFVYIYVMYKPKYLRLFLKLFKCFTHSNNGASLETFPLGGFTGKASIYFILVTYFETRT